MSTFSSLKSAFQLSDMIIQSYVGDMEDAELLTRPGEGCNHLAWQLGHLVSSEANLINMIKDGSSVSLPEGFAEKHSKETTGNDDAASFASKEEYLDLYQKTRANSLAVLEGMTEEEFQAEPPEHFRSICADVGGLAMLIANHPMMHAGQFVPVRRSLGKPVVI